MKYIVLLVISIGLSGCKTHPDNDYIRLTNRKGITAQFCKYGARIVNLEVEDKHGQLVNVIWGFRKASDYRHSSDPNYGATIGRYANRIADGQFALGGKNYYLEKNDNNNSIHGGRHGFNTKDWEVILQNDSAVMFSYHSPNGEASYPGNLEVKVTYTLTSDNSLKIEYTAKSDEPTVVNLTNHAYWNLNGPGSGTILKHRLQINADFYTPVDDYLIPIGRLDNVAGTPFDFIREHQIGERIGEPNLQLHNCKGYDHNFVLKLHRIDSAVAQVIGEQSGICMQVFTDQPGIQFYTGNFMEGKNIMNHAERDAYRSGFCLETQHFPNSPNQQNFPSTELKPGQTFRSITLYHFSTAK